MQNSSRLIDMDRRHPCLYSSLRENGSPPIKGGGQAKRFHDHLRFFKSTVLPLSGAGIGRLRRYGEKKPMLVSCIGRAERPHFQQIKQIYIMRNNSSRLTENTAGEQVVHAEPPRSASGHASVSSPEERFPEVSKLSKDYADLQTFFREEGREISVSGHAPVLLNSNHCVWLIQSGPIDIFSVCLESGDPAGMRRHLLRLEFGQIFFGIDAPKYGRQRSLIAVGAFGSSLLEIDLRTLHAFLTISPEYVKEFGRLIDEWIAAVSLCFKQRMMPKDCFLLEPSGANRLEKQTNYHPEKGVGWIKHLTGASAFLGRTDFPEIGRDGYFPVAEKVWFQALQAVELKYQRTAEMIATQGFWAFLEHFHLFILDCLCIDEQQRIAAEKARLKQKDQDAETALGHAFVSLASVVKSREEVYERSGDALLSACRAIGAHMKISFVPHPDAQKGRNSLEDIARASGVRMRQVVLQEKWWQRDGGPLLAVKAEEKTPVALLPVSPRTYELFDPLQGTRTPVTGRIAASLEGIAYMFYTPFPDTALTLKDWFRLGKRGLGKDLLTVVLMGLLGAGLGMLTPILTGVLFDSVIPGSAVNQLAQIGVILIVCAITQTMLNVTKAVAMMRISGKIALSVQAGLLDRLLKLPPSFFRDYTAGDLAKRVLGVDAIHKTLSGVAIKTLLNGIFSLMYVGLLFYYNRYLAAIGLGICLLNLLVTSGLSYLNIRYQQPLHEIEGKISGMVLQLLTGISKLRITGTEDRAFALWAKTFSAKRRLAFASKQLQNILATYNAVIPVLASLLLYYLVLSQLMNPETVGLSTGKFLAFLAAYATLQASLISMGSTLINSLRVVPLYKRLQPVLSELPETDATKAYPGEITGDIEVSHVNFRYDAEGLPILNDVSLHVQSGEFVAIVGASGSGKSTLMRLLLGFDHPESGTIYYDGQDLANVDVLEIRRQMGVVLQNSQIMAGSIYDNIVGAGSATLTLDDAWEAARMAGCDDDINTMPMGMHTYLPPGGGSLSGGQRQRVIIARAIVKKPRILFFDEATSALDNRTQAIVSESIERLQSTRIVIAHRLSTIMNADKIYVMDKGRIVQCGTYDELMNQDGLFAELAKRQLA